LLSTQRISTKPALSFSLYDKIVVFYDSIDKRTLEKRIQPVEKSSHPNPTSLSLFGPETASGAPYGIVPKGAKRSLRAVSGLQNGLGTHLDIPFTTTHRAGKRP
jgi:hypothetical protein